MARNRHKPSSSHAEGPPSADQLFSGIRAYFVGAGMQTLRLKVWGDKLQQFGGRLEERLSHEITHVFALNIEKLKERFSPRKAKQLHMKALTYEWIQECLVAGTLLPIEPFELREEPKSSRPAAEHVGSVMTPVDNRDGYVSPRDRDSGSEQQATSGDTLLTTSSIEGTVDDFNSDAHSSIAHDGEVSPSLCYIPPNLNQNITQPFIELRDIYKDALGDDRRSFSYHKAVSVLEKLPFKVDNIDQVRGLPTIGKSMLENIHEILETGKLSKLENFKNDERVRTLRLFSSVWGIGPATAQKLFEKGCRSLDDLKHEPSLTASQRVGLQFHDDLDVKIPRNEVKEMETLVKQALEKIQPGMNVLCGGSYRRGKAFCGDMDFVITHPDGQSHKGFLPKLIATLKNMGFLTEDLLVSATNSLEETDSGVDTYYGLCKYPGRERRHRIDFKVYSAEMYPFGLIAWTGNDVLNRRLRLLAESKGYRLDDTGLFPTMRDSGGKKVKSRGHTVPCKSEREVFDFLGFPWLEPHERNL